MPLPVGPEERQGFLRRFLSGLSFPKLFLMLSGLFLLDLAIPDMIPFLDEMFLAGLTVLFGMWQKRSETRRGSSS